MSVQFKQLTICITAWLLIGFGACRPGSTAPPAPLAQVGQLQISAVDLQYRRAVEAALETPKDDDVVLAALVTDALQGEVGRLFGVAATPDEVAALDRHADANTKAPEVLAKVRRVFGENRAAYERLYLTPRVVNNKLRACHARNAEIHGPARQAIERAYALVRVGSGSLESVARQCGLRYAEFEHARQPASAPAMGLSGATAAIPSADPLGEILAGLTEGEVCRNIVEDDSGYKVIRLLRKKHTAYAVDAVIADKRPFDEWFHQEAGQIEIKVFDRELARQLMEKYARVWWVKKWLIDKRTGE